MMHRVFLPLLFACGFAGVAGADGKIEKSPAKALAKAQIKLDHAQADLASIRRIVGMSASSSRIATVSMKASSVVKAAAAPAKKGQK